MYPKMELFADIEDIIFSYKKQLELADIVEEFKTKKYNKSENVYYTNPSEYLRNISSLVGNDERSIIQLVRYVLYNQDLIIRIDGFEELERIKVSLRELLSLYNYIYNDKIDTEYYSLLLQ